MHLQVNIRADNKALFCSIIYADNYYVSRRALWHNLPDIAMREFKECVQRMQVMDVNATGLHGIKNRKVPMAS
ncbi:hypothetical protein Tco_1007306 [Tanacetum coccineum]